MSKKDEHTLTGGIEDFNNAEQTVTGGIEDFRREGQTVTGGLEERKAPGTESLEAGEFVEKVDWEIGDVIDGKYEVLKVLGQGAMGIVYKVHHREWNLELAVKMPLLHLVANEALKARFIIEAQTWVDLGLHPNIVQCWYVRELGEIPRVFMDYLEGGSLKDWIQAGNVTPGEWDKILDLTIQACDGLGYAHEHGVEVHRDVKPGNMLMTPGGELRVTDFGIAKREGSSDGEGKNIIIASDDKQHTMTMTGTDLGTPEYSAPEQWGKARHADARADIYALGGVLFEMCCGRRPFDDKTHNDSPYVIISRHLFSPAPDPRDFNKDIPDILADLMLRCLAKESNKRPHSMAELREQLALIYKEIVGKPYRRNVPQAAELRSNALNNRAVSLLDLGQAEQALATWDDALKLDAYHPESVYNKALWEWHTCKIADDEALRRLEHAKHANRRVSMLLGLVHLEREAADEAEQEFAAALDDPEFIMSGSIWQALGDTQMAQANYDEAEQSYQKVLELIPDDPEGLQRLTLAQKKTRLSGEQVLFPWKHCAQIVEGHRKGITAVAVTPDGRHVVSGSRDKTLKLWDLDTRQYLQTFKGHPEQVTAVTVTPDGRFIISGSCDNTLRLWELASGELLETFEGHKDRVSALGIAPDGQHVVSASWDQTLRLWDISTGKCLRVFKGHQDQVTTAAITPDGQSIVSGSEDGTRRVWDISTGKCVHIYKGKWFAKFLEAFEAVTLAVTSDGEYAVSGGWDNVLRMWNLKTGQKVWSSTKHQNRITAITMTPDGQCIVTGSRDKTVRLWDLERGGNTRTFEGHKKQVNAVAVTPDGHTIISGSDDSSLKLWNIKTAACFRTFEGYHGHQQDITTLAITPNGKYAVSGSLDKTLKIWELQNTTCRRTCKGHRKEVTALCITHDGEFAVSGSADTTLKLWNLSTAQCVHTYKGHKRTVTTVKITPDGNFILSGSSDKTLRLWDSNTGECCQIFEGHKKAVNAVEISSDGEFAVSGSADMTLRVWNLTTGHCTNTLKGRAHVTAITETPDGHAVIVGKSGGVLQLRDLKTMTCQQVFQGHKKQVTSAVMTIDGRFIVSAGEDGTIRLWDCATTKCLRTFGIHQGHLTSVAVTPNGQAMLSGGPDGILRIWNLEPNALHYEASIHACRQHGHKELEASKEHFQKLLYWAHSSWETKKVTAAYRYLTQARAVPGYERASAALALNAKLGTALPRKHLREGWFVHTLHGHKKGISAVAVTPDGRFAISGSQDATLRLWDVASAECVRIYKGPEQNITAVAITPDGRFVVSGSEDKTLHLWDIKSAKCLRTYTGHTQRITTLAIFPYGRFILSGSDDRTMRLWNPATAKCLQTFKGARKNITAMAIAPDNQFFVSGTEDGMLAVWNLTTVKHSKTFQGAKPVQSFKAHQRGITTAAVTSDGRFILSGSKDATLRLWNPGTAKNLITFKGHLDTVTGVTITPDARFALSGSDDKTLRLWDILTGAALWIFEGHQKEVKAVAMTPDARFAISGGDDTTLRIWELDWELEPDEKVVVSKREKESKNPGFMSQIFSKLK